MLALKADFLNKHCHCTTLEKGKADFPQYYSAYPHFIARAHVAQIEEFIRAYENLLVEPSVQEKFLGAAGMIEKGIFNSYDFHTSATGPQLIEINSNAAGGMLGLWAHEHTTSCCRNARTPHPFNREDLVQMFRNEHALRFPGRELKTVAIVDENPDAQFFYSEFKLVAELLAEQGIRTFILAPEALEIKNGIAYSGEIPLDFIYNRTTDFYFEKENLRTLKAIYEQGLATVSPNPQVHALYANKENLAFFWSDAAVGLPEAALKTVRAHLPQTIFVTPENRESLWQDRRQWFFKPAKGFGGKGVYRGDKLTRKVWENIAGGGYLAQKYIIPDERQVTQETAMKFDVRVYTYGAKILGIMARYYQGQTTNFRTEGGGLAGVLVAA